MSKHLTAEEKEIRAAAESRISDGKLPTPPKYLSKEQRAIFNQIRKLLKDSGILCRLDSYVLTRFSIAVDRLTYIEQEINDDPDLLRDKELMASKDKYTKDFFRCCSELCLSPQARAKMALASLNAEKDKQDPLLEVLKELNG